MGEKERQYLSKGDFLAAITGRLVDFELPDGAGMVQIRALSVQEAQELRQKYPPESNPDGIEMGFDAILRGVVNPKLSPGDVAELRRASVPIFNALGQKIMALSGLSETEELEKKVGSGS